MIKIKKALNYGLSAFLIGVLVFVLLNRQGVTDSLALLNYSPTAEIKALADSSGMSDKGRKVFYVHKPEILDSEVFNNYCTENEETIVLGCYNGVKIYIFNVKDARLEGIEEVTAAHEMLHAQYDRLGSSQKVKVNKLIEMELGKLTDERILKNIEAYRKKDPSIVINEAHSILATEVKTLSPELETYYSQYFNNRTKVVNISESYESVFTSIKNQVENYDYQLSVLKTDIENREKDLEIRANELTSWSSELDKLRSDGSISEYNSQVYSYNSSVEKYRRDVNLLKQKITEYNEIVIKRNELAMQQNELYKNIDSRVKDL